MSMTILRVVAVTAGTFLCVVAGTAPAAAQHEHHAPAAGAGPLAITGTVVCVEGPPLGDAIVQLFHGSGATRHLVATALTDAAGRFSVRAAPGSYTIQVAFLGHEPFARPVMIAPAGAAVSLGALPLHPAALQLDAITASAERDRIQLRGGATIVETRTAVTAGGSVADVLRTVPGVEFDADGNISLRGSTSVLVLMNGRRLPLTGDALAAFLKQMPASALERVEAGTSASARQDADGMAGVVNLVFHVDAESGPGTRSAALSAATEDHYMAAGSASGALGSLLSWDVTWSSSGMRPRTDATTTRESLLAGDPVRLSVQDSRARATHRLHSFMAAGTVGAGGPITVTGRVMQSWMQGAFRNATVFHNTHADGAVAQSVTNSVLEHTIPAGEAALLVSWTGAGRWQPRLLSEVRTSRVREDFTGAYEHGTGHVFLANTMAASQQQHVLQNDIELTAARVRVEAGQKSQVRRLGSDYRSTDEGSHSAHEFRHDDWIHAAYVAAGGTVDRLEVHAGVRAELDRSRAGMADIATGWTLRAFPSLLLQLPLADQRTRLRLSYGRRINRPDAAALNPWSMGEDDMNSFVGNPRLRPEIADQIDIGVEHHGTAATYQFTPFLRVTHDPIRPIKAVTASGRATTTLENLVRTRAVGADASARVRVGDRTTLLGSTSVYGMATEGLSYRNDGVHMTARLNTDVRIAERTFLQLYAYRRSAQAVEQGAILAATTAELALTRTLGAGDRGRLTLRVSDPFESDLVAFRISDATFSQYSSRRVSRPLASLFFSWAIGGTPREDRGHDPERPAQIF